MTIITRREAAERLRVSMRSLDKLVAEGAGPPAIRIGGRVLFTEDALAAWVQARTDPLSQGDA